MIKNRLAKWVFGSTFAATVLMPAIALAQESADAGALSPEAAAMGVDAWKVYAARAAAAGVVMSIACISAGYAQAKIGSAGAGTLAERPEAGTNLIVLQALPEIIVLLGFVIAFMVGTAKL